MVAAILTTTSIAGAQPIRARRPVDAAATLSVTNENRLPVSVVVLLSGDEYPLGTVDGKKIRMFEVPSDLVGAANVTVLVTPLVGEPIDASEEFKSATILFESGEDALLDVASHAAYSTLNGDAEVNAPAGGGATLRVTNDNRQAVSVVMLGEAEFPLGVVQGRKTQLFEVPSALVGAMNVKVLVTPIIDKPVDGSKDFQSAPITLAPGHEATLHVARRTSHEAQSKLALH
jgi:hypothetical protein